MREPLDHEPIALDGLTRLVLRSLDCRRPPELLTGRSVQQARSLVALSPSSRPTRRLDADGPASAHKALRGAGEPCPSVY